MAEGYQHFNLLRADDVVIIQLIDPKMFDTDLVTAWQDELLELIQSEEPKKMLVDFSRVVHCSTAVINGLLRAKKRVVRNDGQLILCGMDPAIRESYRMLNLDGTVFRIYDSVEHGLTAFE